MTTPREELNRLKDTSAGRKHPKLISVLERAIDVIEDVEVKQGTTPMTK